MKMLNVCASFTFVAVIKHPDTKQFWGEKIYFTYKSFLTSQVRNSSSWSYHIHSQEKMLPAYAQLALIQLKAQAMRKVLPTFSMLLPTSINNHATPTGMSTGQPDPDNSSPHWAHFPGDSRLWQLDNHNHHDVHVRNSVLKSLGK